MTTPEKPSEEISEFDYLSYDGNGLTVKDLDLIKDTALGVSTSNIFKMIMGAAKLAIFFIWFFLRRKIIKEEILIKRNEIHQKQINQNRDEVDVDIPE